MLRVGIKEDEWEVMDLILVFDYFCEAFRGGIGKKIWRKEVGLASESFWLWLFLGRKEYVDSEQEYPYYLVYFDNSIWMDVQKSLLGFFI